MFSGGRNRVISLAKEDMATLAKQVEQCSSDNVADAMC